ncbi:DUF1294 domain-containing protein [Massilia horti]|uniref:DUF1294 domain-containing protein n=1 Tax=Massilia horti TaxID=2562153 RepID=A0A4Y9SSY6_9BURK|nr:DUF1294 domain-containing protein [Massilia horti]TFW29558.1 DUF1294 domain-containing protein [Massilia horti]
MTYLPILAFAGVYLAVELIWAVPPVAAAVYLGASIACFIAYAVDKSAAQSRRRRTPESTLFLLGLAGGWPGAVLAQQWLRHKSIKRGFRAKFWLTVLLNVGMFIWIAFLLDRLR